MNDAPNRRMTRRLLMLLAGSVMPLGLAAPILAADPGAFPSPTFPRPLMLVAVDSLEWLGDSLEHSDYILASPDDEVAPGNYDYVDATGGYFHFFGRNVSGPYTDRAEVCPFMFANGIDALGTGVVDDVETVTKAECEALTAVRSTEGATDPVVTEAPEPTDEIGESVAIGGIDSEDTPIDDAGADDPIALEIAVALIMLLLGIGGLKIIGASLGIGPLSRAPSLLDPGAPLSDPAAIDDPILIQTSPERPTDDRRDQDHDPCSTERTALDRASGHARGLNSVLAGLRDFASQLDQQIVLIEKAAIPAEAGVEAAFLIGGALAPGGGIGWVPDILLGKIFEGVMKDQLKGVIKAGLKSAGASALPGGAEAGEALKDSAAESTLKGMMEDAISAKYLNASISGYHTSMSGLANSLPRKFEAADAIARNMAEATSHLITLYNTGMGVAELIQQSAILRQKHAAILDDIANVELSFETATEKLASVAQDLERCRWVHSPTKEPLRRASA